MITTTFRSSKCLVCYLFATVLRHYSVCRDHCQRAAKFCIYKTINIVCGRAIWKAGKGERRRKKKQSKEEEKYRLVCVCRWRVMCLSVKHLSHTQSIGSSCRRVCARLFMCVCVVWCGTARVTASSRCQSHLACHLPCSEFAQTKIVIETDNLFT